MCSWCWPPTNVKPETCSRQAKVLEKTSFSAFFCSTMAVPSPETFAFKSIVSVIRYFPAGMKTVGIEMK